MFVDKFNVCEFEKKLKVERVSDVNVNGEFSTVNSPNWMMSVLHRCLFLQTEQPKEDDIARCMCMTVDLLCLFSCVEKDPRVLQ